jgi:hypothetical protein
MGRRKSLTSASSFNLDKLYAQPLARVLSHKRARMILQWVLFVKRPLTFLELQYAISITPWQDDLDPECDLPQTFLDATCGLVILNRDLVVRFCRATVQECLSEYCPNHFPSPHRYLACVAITCLTFKAI